MKVRIVIRCSPVAGVPFRRTGSLLADFSNLMSRLHCWVAGHNGELMFETRRLSMRCTRCGWQSPGWTLEGRSRPVVAFPERRRHPRHRLPAVAAASGR